MAENTVYVWTGGANGEKNLLFRKHPDTGGRGLTFTKKCVQGLGKKYKGVGGGP